MTSSPLGFRPERGAAYLVASPLGVNRLFPAFSPRPGNRSLAEKDLRERQFQAEARTAPRRCDRPPSRFGFLKDFQGLMARCFASVAARSGEGRYFVQAARRVNSRFSTTCARLWMKWGRRRQAPDRMIARPMSAACL